MLQDEEINEQELVIDYQFFPHSDIPLHRQQESRPFLFTPVEEKLEFGKVIHIGRKIDRTKDQYRGSTREDRAANNVSLDPANMTSSQEDLSIEKCIAFRSKVVSRHHAEMWVGKDGQLYFRDVGSSSGSFLNRLRLSPSGKESRPYPLQTGDVIQLGVDYQGRQEEIYKAVLIKVFINAKKQVPGVQNRAKLNKALRSLVYAMNPNSQKEDEMHPTDCCICINSIAPFQALFLAPCSHCFHYKCVTPLLGAGFMFQCPVCRQVANLEASVQEPEDFEKETAAFIDDEDESSVDGDAMNLDQQPSSTLPETSFMEPQDRGLTLSRSHDIVAPVHSLQIREESSSPMDIPAPPLPHLASSLAHSPSTPLNNSHMPARMDRTASNSTGDLLMVMDDIHPTYGALQKIISAASNGDQSVLQQEMLQYANRMKQLLESTLNVDPDTQTQIVSQLLGSIPPNHDSA